MALYLLESKQGCFWYVLFCCLFMCICVCAGQVSVRCPGICVVQADCGGEQMLLLMKEGEKGEGNTGN